MGGKWLGVLVALCVAVSLCGCEEEETPTVSTFIPTIQRSTPAPSGSVVPQPTTPSSPVVPQPSVPPSTSTQATKELERTGEIERRHNEEEARLREQNEANERAAAHRKEEQEQNDRAAEREREDNEQNSP